MPRTTPAIPGTWISPRDGLPLSLKQQRRYEGAGITHAEYLAGRPLAAARGHKEERRTLPTAEGPIPNPAYRPRTRGQSVWIKRALAYGIAEEGVAPGFLTFPKDMQTEAARFYVLCFWGSREFQREWKAQIYRYEPQLRTTLSAVKRDMLMRRGQQELFAQTSFYMSLMSENYVETNGGVVYTQGRKNTVSELRHAYNNRIGYLRNGAGWAPAA